jgi:hypothetical protein
VYQAVSVDVKTWNLGGNGLWPSGLNIGWLYYTEECVVVSMIETLKAFEIDL